MTENLLSLQGVINRENTKERNLNKWTWFFYAFALCIGGFLFWLMRNTDIVKYLVIFCTLVIVVIFALSSVFSNYICIHSPRESIVQFNESISGKKILEEERPTIEMYNEYHLIGPYGWPYNIVATASGTKNDAYICATDKCQFTIAGDNPNGYEIRLNVSFIYNLYNNNMDLELDDANTTKTFSSTGVIAGPYLLKFVDYIVPLTNSSYLKIDKRTIDASPIPNENLHYVDVSLPRIVMVKQNVTYEFNLSIPTVRLVDSK